MLIRPETIIDVTNLEIITTRPVGELPVGVIQSGTEHADMLLVGLLVQG